MFGDTHNTINFIDNPSTAKGCYICVEIDVEKVLQSWKQSIFAKEWLNEKSHIKAFETLDPSNQQQLLEIKTKIDAGEGIPRPVLGIGLMDHIEIGSARAIFVYLCALGNKSMAIHIPESNKQDFQEFLSSS